MKAAQAVVWRGRRARSLRRLADLLALRRLAHPHLGIEPVQPQQLGVAARFGQPALVEHEDPVGVGDGRQAVGDRQAGAVRRRPRCSVARMSCSVRVSSALVASSSSRIGGFLTSVRAIATRCFSPPDSLSPRSPTSVSKPCGRRSISPISAAPRAAASTSAMLGAVAAIGDVVADGVVEQHRYPAGRCRSRRASESCVTSRMSCPSIRMRPGPRVVEAEHQPGDGRLAGARGADHRRRCCPAGTSND